MKFIKTLFLLLVIFSIVGLLSTCDFFSIQPRANDTDPVNIVDDSVLVEIPRDGLIAEYLFDGDTYDTSGNGNNGIEYDGVALTTNRFESVNSAYSFDGVDDKIIVTNNGDLSFNPGTENLTVTAWVKRNSINTYDAIVMDRSDTYSTGLYSYSLMGNQNGEFYFSSWDGNSGGHLVESPDSYIAGEWHLITGVLNGTTAILYIDGLEVAQSDFTPFINTENNDVTIGNWHAPSVWYHPFDGDIDDVRLYDRALSETEIQTLYENIPFVSMVSITGGTFTMGDTWGAGDSEELPTHLVTLSDFSIGKYEVTFSNWNKVYTWAMTNGYNFANAGIAGNDGIPSDTTNEPVTYISWRDMIVWCNAASEFKGLTPVYTYAGNVIKDSRDINSTACDNAVCDWTGNGYRLPTEAEWEYAAKGGNTDTDSGMYAGSATVDDVSWNLSNSGSDTQPVGTKAANELGLYDMSGNVWENCGDYWERFFYSATPSNDPHGPSSGTERVIRGGSFSYIDWNGRSANRSGSGFDTANNNYGFRLARKQ